MNNGKSVPDVLDPKYPCYVHIPITYIGCVTGGEGTETAELHISRRMNMST
jgi:hypothetical protein